MDSSYLSNSNHMKCRRCIKEVKSSVKIVNQKTKSFVSISDFVHPGLRRVAFLSYVSWSKYNPCVLTTTNILYYEDLATGRQKQSDPQIMCGLFTTCILVTWHIIKREKTTNPYSIGLRVFRSTLNKLFL